MKNKHAGSRLEDFFAEEGIAAAVESAAVKKAFVAQLEQQMKQSNKKKTSFRSALRSPTTAHRLFSDNPHTELDTLVKAARVVDCDLVIRLTPRRKRAKPMRKTG